MQYSAEMHCQPHFPDKNAAALDDRRAPNKHKPFAQHSPDRNATVASIIAKSYDISIEYHYWRGAAPTGRDAFAVQARRDIVLGELQPQRRPCFHTDVRMFAQGRSIQKLFRNPGRTQHA